MVQTLLSGLTFSYILLYTIIISSAMAHVSPDIFYEA